MYNRKRIFNGLYFIIISLLLYFIYKWPDVSDLNIKWGYFVLVVSFLVISLHASYVFCNRGLDIFEPIVIFFLFDYMCLVIAPLIFCIIDDTDCHGVYVMDGCVKGTLLHLLAYFGLYIGYFSKNTSNFRIERYVKNNKPIFSKDCYDELKILNINIVIWTTSFILSMFFLILDGKSIGYILTLGLTGAVGDSITSDTPLKFLINVSYCMIPCCIVIAFSHTKKGLKFLTTFLTAVVYMVRGTRFIIVVMAIAFMVTYYLKNRKKPKSAFIFTSVIVFIVFATVMQFVRSDLRGGNSINLHNMGIDALTTMLHANFDIYQTYYGTVADVPKIVSHTYGECIILSPFIYVIPRIIWHTKPLASSMALLRSMISSVGTGVIVRNGMSTVWMTEVYLDFGTVGCFFYPLLIGRLLAIVVSKLRFDELSSIVFYSVFYASLMQWVIRGYTAMNIWMMFFLLLPIILAKKIKI